MFFAKMGRVCCLCKFYTKLPGELASCVVKTMRVRIAAITSGNLKGTSDILFLLEISRKMSCSFISLINQNRALSQEKRITKLTASS